MDFTKPFSFDSEVRGFDCGYGGPLKPLPLMNFLQEAAGLHADSLGWGIENLQAEGRTWMLSRIDLRIHDRLPRAGDRIRVITWPAGLDRLFALRDFRMQSADGRDLVTAVYAYLIVDRAARRPLRPERILGPDIETGMLPHPFAPSFALPKAQIDETLLSLKASRRHLDNNGHVNNAYIVDWLVDAAPDAVRLQRELRALRVEFIAEVLAGDELRTGWAEAAAVPPPADSPAASAEGCAAAVTELRRGDEVLARAWSCWR